MSRCNSDRRARDAFVARVCQCVPPGGVIFDFGCGPGIDAKLYAQRGYQVDAYDADNTMCEAFGRHCQAEIRSGKVRIQSGLTYPEFLDSASCRAGRPADIVTANFAPMNLVDDPHRLFQRFSVITKPRAKVLISVLNPYFVKDMRYAWWWRNLIPFLRNGRYSVSGGNNVVHRRSPNDLRLAAQPYFELKAVARGVPGRQGPRWFALTSSQYLFLLFEKS